MSASDRFAAEIQLCTRLVSGTGRWARVSRCMGGAPLVRLFETRAKCDALEKLGKKCGPDCVGIHETIEVQPLVDSVPIELGYREKAR
jgi:hypothetical protein